MKLFPNLIPIAASAAVSTTAAVLFPKLLVPLFLGHIVFCGWLGWSRAKREPF